MNEITVSIEMQFEVDLDRIDNIAKFISENIVTILENVSNINAKVIDVIVL